MGSGGRFRQLIRPDISQESRSIQLESGFFHASFWRKPWNVLFGLSISVTIAGIESYRYTETQAFVVGNNEGIDWDVQFA
jgi:hypothetical protein